MYNKSMNLIMNTIKNKLLIVFVLSFMFLSPLFSFAQNNNVSVPGVTPANSVKIKNPIKVSNINDFIKTILEGVLKIGIPLIALAIIYSGFLFITAQGKEAKLTEAKNALLYTVIGAAILLGSWALAQLISETVLSL